MLNIQIATDADHDLVLVVNSTEIRPMLKAFNKHTRRIGYLLEAQYIPKALTTEYTQRRMAIVYRNAPDVIIWTLPDDIQVFTVI
jgi:phospholipid N-methyltransferase